MLEQAAGATCAPNAEGNTLKMGGTYQPPAQKATYDSKNPSSIVPTAAGRSRNPGCLQLLVDKYCPAPEKDNPDTPQNEALTKCNTDHFLPPFRWASATDIMSTQAWYDINAKAFDSFVGLMFTIAAFTWKVIVGFGQLVFSIDTLAGEFGRAINDVFRRVADAISYGGLVAVVIFMSIIAILRSVLGNKRNGSVFSIVLTLVLPLALLMVLTNGADAAKGLEDPSANVLSPVGLARKASDVAALPAGAISKVISSNDHVFANDPGFQPSCSAYLGSMYDTFQTAWIRGHSGDPAGGAASMVAVSGLWNEAFLTYFNQAQYRDAPSGSRIACHQLENQAGVKPAEQVVQSLAAGYPNGAHANEAGTIMSGNVAAEEKLGNNRAFTPFVDIGALSDTHLKRQATLLWGACGYMGGESSNSNSWSVDPAYRAVGDVTSQTCADFWSNVDATPGPKDKVIMGWEGSTKSEIAAAAAKGETKFPKYAQGGDCGEGTTCLSAAQSTETVEGVKQLVYVFKGDIGPAAIYGLFAILVALLYAYILLGLFAGVIVAKVGFALMVAFLPGILLLLAVPSAGKAGGMGKRLFKMMLGWMLASVFLSVAISSFLLIIGLMRSLVGQGGFMTFVMPIVAFFLVRTLMKKAGLGDIMKPSAGIALAAGAAAAASGQGMQGLKKAGRMQQNLAQGRKSRKAARQGFRRKADQAASQAKRGYDTAKEAGSGSVKEAALAAYKDPRRLPQDFMSMALLAAGAKAGVNRNEKDAAEKKTAEDAARDAQAKKDELARLSEGSDPLVKAADEANKKNPKTNAEARAASDEYTDEKNPLHSEAENAARVAADADVLSDSATSKEQSSGRKAEASKRATVQIDAGTNGDQAEVEAMQGAGRLAGLDGSSARAETKERLNELRCTRATVRAADGSPLLNSKGQPVMAFVGPDGLSADAATSQALAAQFQDQVDAGEHHSGITMNGVRYKASTTLPDLGAEGADLQRRNISNEYGLDRADVVVGRGAAVAMPRAATEGSATAVEGTSAHYAPSAEQQFALLKNISQVMRPQEVEQLQSLSEEGQAAAYEVIVATLGSGGKMPDGAVLAGIDEREVMALHSDKAALGAYLSSHTYKVPEAVMRVAMATGQSAQSVHSRSAEYQTTVVDVVYQGGAASDHMTEVITGSPTGDISAPSSAKNSLLARIDSIGEKSDPRELDKIVLDMQRANVDVVTASSAGEICVSVARGESPPGGMGAVQERILECKKTNDDLTVRFERAVAATGTDGARAFLRVEAAKLIEQAAESQRKLQGGVAATEPMVALRRARHPGAPHSPVFS